MGELLRSAADAVTAAGANPLALVALLLLVAAWLVVALKVRRNRHLLTHLSQLPEKDRLKALQMEMGVTKIRGGLSPEQWLRHNLRVYSFFGFAILCLTLVILGAMAFHARGAKLKPGVDVSLHDAPPTVVKPEEPAAVVRPEESAATARPELPAAVPQRGRAGEHGRQPVLVKANVVWGAPQMAEAAVPPELIVTYSSRLKDGVSHIAYQLPYLELAKRGGPVRGVNYLGSPFKWRFPELSIKVVNNTEQNLVLSRAFLDVVSSHIVDEPVVLVEDLSVNRIVFRNEGWGDVVNPEIRFTVSESRQDNEVPLFADDEHRRQLQTFSESAGLSIEPYLPDRLRNANLASVQGRLEYGPAGKRRSLDFQTRVSLQVRAAVGIPPSREYEVFFKAGAAGVTEEIGLAQEIRSSGSDHFLFRLGSDKSSRSRIKIRFRTAGGEVLPGGDLLIDLFVPRSTGKLVLSRK